MYVEVKAMTTKSRISVERVLSERIDSVRHFNRFYTRQIGVLQESLLNSGYSLSEVRILYELAHSKQPTAKALAGELGVDAGYLSRILTNFQEQKLVERKSSESDGRQMLIRLTKKGQSEFAKLDSGAREQINLMLKDH